MPRYSRYTAEQKIQACEDYLSGVRSVSQICINLRMSSQNGMTIYKWVDKYKIWGSEAFISLPKYNIGSKSMLERWVLLYNANRELKDYNPKQVYMADAGRKTTIEERREIVKYCIEHNRNYKETASITSPPGKCPFKEKA